MKMRKLITAIVLLALSLYCHDLKAQGLVKYTPGAGIYNETQGPVKYGTLNMRQINTTGDWRRHKRFKTAGWIALGVGVPLTIVGLITTIASVENPRVKSGTGEWLTAAGLVTTIGSIPLFILSSKYKRKATNQRVDVSLNFKGNGLGLVIQR